MDWIYLFTSFSGRISRQPFWIAFALLTAGQFGAQSLVSQNDTLVVILDLAFTYPQFAVSVKRSNDRDLPPWPVSLFFALSVALDLFTLLDGPLDPESTLAYLTLYPLALMQLILLLEFGFRTGTKGPNRFGEDPLAAGKPRLLHQYAAVRAFDGLVHALTPEEPFLAPKQRPSSQAEELPRSVKYWCIIVTAVNVVIFVEAALTLRNLMPDLVMVLVMACLPVVTLISWKRIRQVNSLMAGFTLSMEWCAVASIISSPLFILLFIFANAPD